MKDHVLSVQPYLYASKTGEGVVPATEDWCQSLRHQEWALGLLGSMARFPLHGVAVMNI